MGKLLVAIGVLLLVAGLTWYKATRQLAEVYGQCLTELDYKARLTNAQSEGDLRFFFVQVVNCVDKRKGPLASLVFDRQKTLDKLEASYKKGGFSEIRGLLELSAEMENMQSDQQAAYDTWQFRQGAYGNRQQRKSDGH